MSFPRVALFPDSFHEVNGVAHTFRHFAAYAEQHQRPLLCVHAGAHTAATVATQRGSMRFLQLARSRWAFRLERDLAFDPLFFRHAARIERALRHFRPDVVHLSGPSELGIAGAYFAWKLGIPLAASWHTNLHEYAAQRLPRWLREGRLGVRAQTVVRGAALDALTRFYRLARVLYAPNPQLRAELEERTGRPCRVMPRGVDTTLFTPARRPRFRLREPVLGFVGRLSVEKNVALLPQIDAELRQRGVHAHWMIVGQGEQEAALRHAFGERATFTGVLRGADLAAAYAGMDVFVFPSATDTFGNVVLEALASGVPAVVTRHGGPAHIVTDGRSGSIVPEPAFASTIAALLQDQTARAAMALQAREEALRWSWDVVFEGVYAGYEEMLASARRQAPSREKPQAQRLSTSSPTKTA